MFESHTDSLLPTDGHITLVFDAVKAIFQLGLYESVRRARVNPNLTRDNSDNRDVALPLERAADILPLTRRRFDTLFSRAPLMPGILCEHCTGACCRYIALPIDTPTSDAEFEDVRWYLLHEGVSVFIEDGDWYINVVTNCRHLQPDYRCGIYETRPKICRTYTTDNCDYHSGDYGWNEHFTCADHLDEYRKRIAAEKRDKKSRRGQGGERAAATKKRIGGSGRLKVRLGAAGARRHRRDQPEPAFREPTILPDRDTRGVPLPVLRTNSPASPSRAASGIAAGPSNGTNGSTE